MIASRSEAHDSKGGLSSALYFFSSGASDPEDRHPYRLFPKFEGIEHRTTQISHPQSNSFIERCHRMLLDDHPSVSSRSTVSFSSSLMTVV